MDKNKLIKIDEIRHLIYTVRGVQVILDRDLAIFYGVKPIRLREQVKRNAKRFPSDFMFQLTDGEINLMVSQNAIPSKQHLGGSRPIVFTEQGVAAISAVLTSERAIEVNIQIVRAFVAMRRFISANAQVFHRLDAVEKKQIEHKADADRKFEKLFNAIEAKEIIPKQGIFFNGQVFDAYCFLSDLFRTAKKSISIIDNYIDDTVLTHLVKRHADVKVTILTRSISKHMMLDVKKFNEQYPAINIMEFPNAHDRFIVIDSATVYHFGASLKDLGKKWFAFSKMEIGAVEMIGKLEMTNGI
jgi:hypothetical protein